MRKKLATWKASTLSMAGRRILTQSSLASVPTYTMQSLAMPVSTCNDIDKVCRNFLWGHGDNSRKIHTINWNDVCRPREVGGLGLRKAQDFNLAFLSKMAWQVFTNQEKLWVKVMRDKYVKGVIFYTSRPAQVAHGGGGVFLKGETCSLKA